MTPIGPIAQPLADTLASMAAEGSSSPRCRTTQVAMPAAPVRRHAAYKLCEPMSSSMALRRSPKPGAFTAATKNAAIRALEAAAGGPLTFRRMLRSIREGEAESLETFARKLGVSRMHVHDIEKQRRGVSVERAAQWATLLGYHPEQFVQLALQAQLDAAGLRLEVAIKRAA